MTYGVAQLLLYQSCMRNLSICSAAIARAIKASNGGRLNNEAHKALMADILKTSSPDESIENVTSVGNLSALNQELERYGLITTVRELPAFYKAVKDELTKLG